MKPTWTLLPDIDVPPNPPRNLAWEQKSNLIAIIGRDLYDALGEDEPQWKRIEKNPAILT